MKRTAYKDYRKTLKKAGMWKESEDAYLKSGVVFCISILATVSDAFSIYMTIDPIFKSLVVMTIALTFTASAVLDIFPAYWPYAIQKINSTKKENEQFMLKVVKTIFIISVLSWIVAFITLCLLRASMCQHILIDSLREVKEIIAQGDTYQPDISTFMMQTLMLFLDFVNLGTSAAVLLAAFLSTVPEDKRKRRIENTIKIKLKHILQPINAEINQLDNLINDDDYEEYEKKKHELAGCVAYADGNRKEAEAMEALMMYLQDSDCDVKVINEGLNLFQDVNHKEEN